MYVCMYYVCMYVCMYVLSEDRIRFACICVYVCVCVFYVAYIYVYTYIYTCICICIYMHAHTDTHAHTHNMHMHRTGIESSNVVTSDTKSFNSSDSKHDQVYIIGLGDAPCAVNLATSHSPMSEGPSIVILPCVYSRLHTRECTLLCSVCSIHVRMYAWHAC